MIKELLKRNVILLRTFSAFYNLLHYNNAWKYSINNYFDFKSVFLKKTFFFIRGKKNQIFLGHRVRVINCRFTILGNNCKILINGGSTIISNVHFWCQDDNSSIIIGDDFTMEGGHIAATEGESITIGNNCMFSNDVEIRNGDSHSILDIQTNKRINPAEKVVIGDHVWLTAHARILKGSVIPSNSIIGNSSLVTSKLESENALYSGIPCRLIKENINWDRSKI